MTNQPRRIEFELRAATNETIRKFQLRAWQALTSASPVDTGHFRSGWTPSVGSPVSDRLERPTDTAEAKSRARPRSAKNQAVAEAIAKTYQVERGRVFIVNGVPYGRYLNAGSSSQAPARFVERSIERAIRSLSRLL